MGVLLIAGSVLVGARLLASADDTTAIWAMDEDLTRGASLSQGALVVQQVRFGDAAAAESYLPASQPLPDDAVLGRDVAAGELLPRAAVSSQGAVPTFELPVVVGAASAPEDLRAGQTVDVWVVPDTAGTSRPREAELLLEQVPVVSAAQDSGPLGEAATRQVLLGLGADAGDQLPAVLAGLLTGTVVLVRQQG